MKSELFEYMQYITSITSTKRHPELINFIIDNLMATAQRSEMSKQDYDFLVNYARGLQKIIHETNDKVASEVKINKEAKAKTINLKLLQTISDNPGINATTIAAKLDMKQSERGVEVEKLVEKGYVICKIGAKSTKVHFVTNDGTAFLISNESSEVTL